MTLITERPNRLQTARKSLTVDISDMKISRDPTDVIVTYSLGSCVGLTLYDPVAGIGGMIHCMLPLSKIDPDKARLKPYMFIDTGVAAMLGEMYDMNSYGAGWSAGSIDMARTALERIRALAADLEGTDAPTV